MRSLEDFGELSRAEREFADACQAGGSCAIGDGALPDPDNTERAIRGSLVRFFVLGGDNESPVHESGIDLQGAVITQHFDLSGSDSDCDLALRNCLFQRRPRMVGAQLRSLDLTGTTCPGIDAEGLRTKAGVKFGPGFIAKGTVRLVRSRIGADLDCTGAALETPDGDALNADGSEIEGSIFLRGLREEDETKAYFTCIGTARFVSSRVGDSIMILDARFDSGGQKYALSLALATIRRQLTFKRFAGFDGRLNLSGAGTYSLNDDPTEETGPKDMILNGFEYVHFSGKASMDVVTRLKWLSWQKPEEYGQDFWLQPYGQLATVLRNTGHESDAREVFVHKEMLQSRVALSLAKDEGRILRVLQIWIGDLFMRHVVGYGYKPQRSLIWMAIILISATVFFHQVWKAGDMTPAAAPVLVSKGWNEALSADPVTTAETWSSQTGAGQDYETFHPLAYSFDLFVPLVDLGQQSAWGPSTERGPLGRIAWWLRWVIEIVGWVVTALAAAAVTGLVRRD